MALSREKLEEMQQYAVGQFDRASRNSSFDPYESDKLATSAATAAATIQLVLNQLDEKESQSGSRLVVRAM